MAGALLGLGAGLVGMVLVGLVVLLVSAIVLRLACKICGVTVPSFLKAIGVSFLVMIAWFIVNVVVGLVIRVGAHAAGIGPHGASLVAGLISLVVAALIATVLYIPLLGTSFGKALLVCLVQFGIFLVLAVIVAVVITVIGMLVAFVARSH
jgi:hypothetical protein